MGQTDKNNSLSTLGVRLDTVENDVSEVKKKMEEISPINQRLAVLENQSTTTMQEIKTIRHEQSGMKRDLNQLIGSVQSGAKVFGFAINNWAVLFAALVGSGAAAIFAKLLL